MDFVLILLASVDQTILVSIVRKRCRIARNEGSVCMVSVAVTWGLAEKRAKKLCPGITDQCNGHGKCDEVTGECVCALPWEGQLCNVSNCYNNGIWNVSTSKCACKSSYTGAMCEFKFAFTPSLKSPVQW